jgi:hypothetical protein
VRLSVVITSLALLAVTAGCGSSKASDSKAADLPRATPTPIKVVVMVDKKKKTETMTTAATVRAVLDQVGVQLGPHDLVTPPAEAPPAATIKVMHLLSDPVTKMVKIPPPIVKKKSSKIPPWSQKVLKKGRAGLKRVQTAYVRRHGKKVKAILSQEIKRKPVAEVIAVGPQSAGAGAAAKLNWSALAKCESGGNPRAVNPAGYYGLYQFNRQSWATVGGSGLPSQASAAEQTYRAQLLYNRVNGRWQGQWPSCGHFLFS